MDVLLRLATLLAALALLSSCASPRPAAPVLLRAEVSEDRLRSIRSDRSIPAWAADEEVVAVCDAGPGETLVLTTHRVLTVRAGWARAPQVAIRGHEVVERDGRGLRLVGRTAIGSSSGAVPTGRCDPDAVAPLVADVVALRREGGTAAELLERHERIAARERARAEAAAREAARRDRDHPLRRQAAALDERTERLHARMVEAEAAISRLEAEPARGGGASAEALRGVGAEVRDMVPALRAFADAIGRELARGDLAAEDRRGLERERDVTACIASGFEDEVVPVAPARVDPSLPPDAYARIWGGIARALDGVARCRER